MFFGFWRQEIAKLLWLYLRLRRLWSWDHFLDFSGLYSWYYWWNNGPWRWSFVSRRRSTKYILDWSLLWPFLRRSFLLLLFNRFSDILLWIFFWLFDFLWRWLRQQFSLGIISSDRRWWRNSSLPLFFQLHRYRNVLSLLLFWWLYFLLFLDNFFFRLIILNHLFSGTFYWLNNLWIFSLNDDLYFFLILNSRRRRDNNALRRLLRHFLCSLDYFYRLNLHFCILFKVFIL